MGLLIGLPLKIFRFFFVILRLAWPLRLILLVFYVLRRRRQGTYHSNKSPGRTPKEPTFDGPVYTVDYEEVDEDTPPKGDGDS